MPNCSIIHCGAGRNANYPQLTLHAFLTQPLDIIKLRTQLQGSKKPKNIIKIAGRILSEEGLNAFWHGHLLGQMHSILAVSSQFYVYEVSTKYVSQHFEWNHEYRGYTRFVCGVFAGCCSATLVIPLEVIRVRQMMVKDQYRNVITGARLVYKYGGLLAFYEGLSASLLQMGPQVGISFVVFSFVQPFLLQILSPKCEKGDACELGTPKPNITSITLASSIAGSLAGFTSKTATYPMDLAKRRLQLGTHRVSKKYNIPSTSSKMIQCKNLIDCITKTIQKDGAWGLYRGWKVTIYKAQVTSIFAFTTYEIICFMLRQFHANSGTS